MAKKPQERELRKHFDLVLGREFGDLPEGDVMLRESIGVYSIEDGNRTSREICRTGFSTQAWGEFRLFSIGGPTAIGLDGKAEFLLNDYHGLVDRDQTFGFPCCYGSIG